MEGGSGATLKYCRSVFTIGSWWTERSYPRRRPTGVVVVGILVSAL